MSNKQYIIVNCVSNKTVIIVNCVSNKQCISINCVSNKQCFIVNCESNKQCITVNCIHKTKSYDGKKKNIVITTKYCTWTTRLYELMLSKSKFFLVDINPVLVFMVKWLRASPFIMLYCRSPNTGSDSSGSVAVTSWSDKNGTAM